MFIRSIVGALIIGIMAPVVSSAQDSSTPAQSSTRAQSAPATQEPVVKENMQLSAEKDVAYGNETSFLTWHGYLDMEAHKQQGAVSTFDLHEFYLSTKAQIA